MPVSLINEVLTKPDDRVKYETFALRSFVEDNRKMSWCTGEGAWGGVVGGEGERVGGCTPGFRVKLGIRTQFWCMTSMF